MVLCKCGCGCGCGQEVKQSNRFIHGHNTPWNKGKKCSQLAGENHWAYGKHPSEETRNKQSKSHKGKHPSEETRNKMKKSRKKRSLISEEQKIKTSHTLMGHLVSEETRNKQSKSKIGKKQSIEHIEKRCKKLRGEKHHNWQGGISFEPYCPKFNNKKKEEIRNQYSRKCFTCEKDEKDNITKGGVRKLCVHHVDADKEQGCNDKPWKLVPLCLSCHMKLHNNKIGKIIL